MYVNIHMSPYKNVSIYLYSIHSKFARLNYYMNIQMHRVIQTLTLTQCTEYMLHICDIQTRYIYNHIHLR